MRKLLTGGTVVVLVLMLAACGGSNGSSSAEKQDQREADMYAISQLEKTFHESISKKNIGEMMSIWAPNATFTYGPGKTATGKKQIEEFWTKSIAFQHDTNWVSDHPAWKMRVTVNGDRGTLHFECHFIEVGTQKVAAVTAADQDVARVNNRWVVTNMVGGTAELKS
jgi:ketosteroid isomerase-like protein